MRVDGQAAPDRGSRAWLDKADPPAPDLHGMTAGQSSPPDRFVLAQLIESELVDQQPPGSRLPPERTLATRFGVSRPVVREALRGLAERGVIEVRPGRGTFTRQVGAADAVRQLDPLLRRRATPRLLVEARLMLECESAALAARRADDNQLAAMASALAAFDRAEGPVDKARFDIAFHLLVAQAAHNPVIELMYNAVAVPVFELMVRSLADPTVGHEGAAYHQQILAAIRAGDDEAARSAMREHISLALQRYGTDLDEPVDVLAQREIRRLLGPLATLDGILTTVRLLDTTMSTEPDRAPTVDPE